MSATGGGRGAKRGEAPRGRNSSVTIAYFALAVARTATTRPGSIDQTRSPDRRRTTRLPSSSRVPSNVAAEIAGVLCLERKLAEAADEPTKKAVAAGADAGDVLELLLHLAEQVARDLGLLLQRAQPAAAAARAANGLRGRRLGGEGCDGCDQNNRRRDQCDARMHDLSHVGGRMRCAALVRAVL